MGIYKLNPNYSMVDTKTTEPVVTAPVEEVAAKVEAVEAKAEEPVVQKAEKVQRELTAGERKCRKALQKLGLKECDGYTRITLKKTRRSHLRHEQPRCLHEQREILRLLRRAQD